MKNNNKFRLDVWGFITLFVILLYVLFLLYPMGYLIRQSVFDAETGKLTLANFAKFFSKSYYFNTLFNSFKISIAATVPSLLIGTPLAYLFAVYKIRGKAFLSILIVVASMSAPFIGACSWILLLGRSGVITTFFKNMGIAVLPQCYVIYTSFKNTEGKIFVDGYSLSSYATAFGKLGKSIQNTIIIPILALVVIILLAILIAYLVVRRRNFLTNITDILSMIPYIVPGTVLGIALLVGFNKPPLLISGTMLIMVAALVIRRLPYTIRSSVAILQQIPMSIEEAAISLGATKMKAFFRITVPMMQAGIVSGAILSWVTMISELSTAIILYTGRTKTLTVAIYTEVIRGNYGTAAALSTILTLLTVASLLLFNKLNGGKDLSL